LVDEIAPIFTKVIAEAVTVFEKARPASDSNTQNGALAYAVANVTVQPVEMEPRVKVPAVSVEPAVIAGDVPHEVRVGIAPSVPI
jgi:uncharacterized protein involved in high-affinity Fe2+ transport